MSTAEIDARRAAASARLTPDDARASALGADLAAGLAFLAPLRDVRPEAGGGAVGVGAGGMPLRADDGPPYAMARPLRALAPAFRAGFVLVPRLAGVSRTPALGIGNRAVENGGRAHRTVDPLGDDAFGDDVLGDDALAAELELGA